MCGCNAGTVTNCENSAKTGAAGSQAYVGGVCGNNYGILTNCENSGEVSADGNGVYVGGICGNNSSNGAVKNCYNIGNVSGTSDYVSKVCGYNDGGTVANCYYLAQTEDGNGGKTEEQFTSGEVAYLLSQGTDGSAWGQTLGESGDAYPALNGKKVLTDINKTKYVNDIIIYGQNAALDGTIDFSIYVAADDNYEWSAKIDGGLADKPEKNADGLYAFTFRVAAKDMANEITLTLSNGDSVTTSVSAYLNALDTSENAKLAGLVNAMKD